MIVRRLRVMLFAGCLLGGLAAAANAQESGKPDTPEKRALVKELYVLTRADKTAENMMSAILNQMEGDLPRQLSQVLLSVPGLSATERANIEARISESTGRVLKRFRELLPQRVNIGEVVEQVFDQVYGKYYSEEELKDLVSFYKSPTGQKSVSLMPQLIQDSIQKTAELVNPKILELTNEIMKEEADRWK
ncbi:MAG TPA: DUF2059 domain-containing protein [Blastocatellia bacterium]|nr:DUF2059 domain-containing protein [Blastocatellia bacterium]